MRLQATAGERGGNFPKPVTRPRVTAPMASRRACLKRLQGFKASLKRKMYLCWGARSRPSLPTTPGSRHYPALSNVHTLPDAEISAREQRIRESGVICDSRRVDGTPERLQQRWVEVAPHVVDTVLLASAIALVWQLGRFEAIRAQSWLIAKIVALLAYIVLGSIALKRGSTRGIRVAAFFAAFAVFAYIVCVAVAKSPWGFVNWM
jgi:uncharacterized membrane protein SirB2